jgi:hypothetical protein
MYIMAGIDGTGDFNDASYERKFRNSFVKIFVEDCRPPNSGYYQRGPSMEGSSTEPRGNKAAEFLAFSVDYANKLGKPLGVFLAGFSRGGASAIHACQQLKKRGVTVDALFLFDAVDRAYGVSADKIPRNVRSVYHARRDGAADSRGIFGNCGLEREDPSYTAYEEAPFHCTHGAMGGTPWTEAGWDGKIYEDHLPISKGMIILLGLPMLPVALTYVATLRTKVTLAQESAGSAAVFVWMKERLETEIAKLHKAGQSGKNVPTG